jgi:hypothetical protein
MSLVVTGSAVGKSLATFVAKRFGKAVVERWTRHRAEHFFEGLVEAITIELNSGNESEDVNKRLADILADETKSEVLFDAYRRICFSKSREIGPRIIGLLTGHLVKAGMMANVVEEQLFEAAELLSDGDFIDFMKRYREHRRLADGITDSKAEYSMLGDQVVVQWGEDSTDLGSGSGSALDIGPFPWVEALGRWSALLNSAGLIEVRVVQSSQCYSQFYKSESGTTLKVAATVIYSAGCSRLYDLVVRSLSVETKVA